MTLIFAGAPFVEQLRSNQRLSGALAAIHRCRGRRDSQPHGVVRAACALATSRKCAPGLCAGMRSILSRLDLKTAALAALAAVLAFRLHPRAGRAGGGHGAARDRATIRSSRLGGCNGCYVIGEIEVTDPATYEDYRKQVLATIQKARRASSSCAAAKSKRWRGGWSPKRAGSCSSSDDGAGAQVVPFRGLRAAHQSAAESLSRQAGGGFEGA